MEEVKYKRISPKKSCVTSDDNATPSNGMTANNLISVPYIFKVCVSSIHPKNLIGLPSRSYGVSSRYVSDLGVKVPTDNNSSKSTNINIYTAVLLKPYTQLINWLLYFDTSHTYTEIKLVS